MPTPEFDMLKMANALLSVNAEIQDLVQAVPEGCESVPGEQFEQQEGLIIDSWSKAVVLAESVKSYMEQ